MGNWCCNPLSMEYVTGKGPKAPLPGWNFLRGFNWQVFTMLRALVQRMGDSISEGRQDQELMWAMKKRPLVV